jgi:hypothetical protein
METIPHEEREAFMTPSEILNIFRNFLSNKEINARVIAMRGVYRKTAAVYAQKGYDTLRDANSREEITLVVPMGLRDGLQDGNLVTVWGVLDRSVRPNGQIQILLNVTRTAVIQDTVLTQDDRIREEARKMKAEKGYGNVDALLENMLMRDTRPKVALLYAEKSITHEDFEKGAQCAKTWIDFTEHRTNFNNAASFQQKLRELDAAGYDVLCVIRGGGGGLEQLDHPDIIRCLASLNTPWIYGVGHEKENPFIRQIADKVIPIPFAVGTYFRDLTERVALTRSQSMATLTRQVEKRYIQRIEDGERKIGLLQSKTESLQKDIGKMDAALTSAKQQTDILHATLAKERNAKRMYLLLAVLSLLLSYLLLR